MFHRFKKATMRAIVEHLNETGRVVSAVMTLLRTRGRLIISCPHDDETPDPE